MTKIDQHSLIPVGLAVIIIGSASIWMTKTDFLTTANAQEIQVVKSTYSNIQTALGQILERLANIEGELKRIPKRNDP